MTSSLSEIREHYEHHPSHEHVEFLLKHTKELTELGDEIIKWASEIDCYQQQFNQAVKDWEKLKGALE